MHRGRVNPRNVEPRATQSVIHDEYSVTEQMEEAPLLNQETRVGHLETIQDLNEKKRVRLRPQSELASPQGRVLPKESNQPWSTHHRQIPSFAS